jgi:hypothetical protein
MIRRRNIIRRRMNHGRARPVPEEISDLESLELRVVWEYLGFDPPINCRRTLDQFGYPSLRDTYARDDDQMLYKLTKREPYQPGAASLPTESTPGIAGLSQKGRQMSLKSASSEKRADNTVDNDDSDDDSDDSVEPDVKDGKVLMVDQLWLWTIDTSK